MTKFNSSKSLALSRVENCVFTYVINKMVSIQSAIAAYSCTVSPVWVKCLSYYSWAGILLSLASVFHLTFAVEGNCLELSLSQHWRRDDLVLSNDRLEQCPRHTCLGHWLVVVWYCEMVWRFQWKDWYRLQLFCQPFNSSHVFLYVIILARLKGWETSF